VAHDGSSLWMLTLVALAAQGCTTALPLQRASTTPAGAYRLSGQLSVTPWCSLSSNPGNCALLPAGFPLPELRLAARHGLAEGTDLGASLHVAPVLPVAAETGLLLDLKRELHAAPQGDGRRHVISASLGGAFVGSTRPTVERVDLLAAAFFGFETPALELIVSPRFVERLSLVDVNADGRRDVLDVPWAGVAVTLLGRGPGVAGVQLEYFAPLSLPGSGLVNLSVGALFDVGP
jgi:hypothetical protein